MPTLNIYCDESTHIQHDSMPYMVLGAITCPTDMSRELAKGLRTIRRNHSIPDSFEIKWTKVSPAQLEFYSEIIDFFFNNDDLQFRAVVANKAGLDHSRFDQTHDDWYYKMMYYLIYRLLPSNDSAFIYLDKKDTNGQNKINKLREVIANAEYDFSRNNVRRLQIVESHHVGLLQLADLLIGAVNYANRNLTTSEAKLTLVNQIRDITGLPLTYSTSVDTTKFNIFHGRGQR